MRLSTLKVFGYCNINNTNLQVPGATTPKVSEYCNINNINLQVAGATTPWVSEYCNIYNINLQVVWWSVDTWGVSIWQYYTITLPKVPEYNFSGVMSKISMTKQKKGPFFIQGQNIAPIIFWSFGTKFECTWNNHKCACMLLSCIVLKIDMHNIKTPFDYGKSMVKQPNQDQLPFNPFCHTSTLFSVDIWLVQNLNI